MESAYKKGKLNYTYKDNDQSSIDKIIKKDPKSQMSILEQQNRNKNQNNIKKTRETSNNSINDKSQIFDPKKYVCL